MNEPRDEALLESYRAMAAELPFAELDGAIAAAAREGLPASASARVRRWRAPLALAASVVLGLGIVLRVALERPDLQAPGASESAPAAAPPAVPAPLPAPTAQSGEPSAKRAVAAPEPPPPAMEAQKSARRVDLAKAAVPAPTPATALEAKPAPAADGFANVAPRDTPIASPAPAARALPFPATAPGALPEQAASSSQAPPAGAASPGGSAAGAPVQDMAPARARAPAAQSDALRALPAEPGLLDQRRERAKASGAVGAASPGVAAEMAESVESALPAEDWIRRIVALRRAGRLEEADASLRRFIARYPDYLVPAEARANPR